ncbi:type II secretion system protein [Alkalimonas sp. MEB108]|uniref:Type II secretion system protein n=1 Tax=Alkalimonas cellulosilytica TaxID=3058395 RepID=A0ABU7J4S4_9GAMM|nr:type II secretion system protein [Alkalimonas sp. MEB108]MEE2001516.1 type II secretion system protein [Alkalimonas sp. MEB108]
MRKRGFTLIELLIVMVIGAVLLSFVGPVGFHQYQRSQQLKEREQLYRILDHSQFEARLSRSPRQLLLEDNRVALLDGDNNREWQFEHLLFEPQQLRVNGNGFWQQPALYWSEHDQPWRLQLNPSSIQHQLLVNRPAAERLPMQNGNRP